MTALPSQLGSAPGQPASSAGGPRLQRPAPVGLEAARALELRGVHRSAEGARRGRLWRMVGRRVFRLTFHNWYGLRVKLLRAFGAEVDVTARIRPSAEVTQPWNLSIGPHSAVGDKARLESSAPIRIGARCTISQYTVLCTEAPDPLTGDLTPRRAGITIGDDCWIAADCYVAPGVTVGDETVVGSRSNIWRSLPAHSICAGEDARRLAERRLPAIGQQRDGKPA